MLSIRDLRKTYGSRQALTGFSLNVEQGETVAVMGPSGCGKSTALKSIIRLVQPDSGAIEWCGRSVLGMSCDELRAFRRRTGFVFQRANLVQRLSVLHNVMLPGVMSGEPAARAERAAYEALESVGMAESAGASVTGLSGGEMQRVAIARAIANRPDLVLWDEPTSALDPILVIDILTLIESLSRALGATMVVVTHEAGFAMRAADRVVLVDQGRVVEEGTPYRVFSCPTSILGGKYAACVAYSASAQKEKASGL
ncbi:MAG TPA: ATP-binding cassette domain-containing protein [Bacillota bacterium]|nr:ATP-binding cassette domain-containing protein [Bacillota bacterium]